MRLKDDKTVCIYTHPALFFLSLTDKVHEFSSCSILGVFQTSARVSMAWQRMILETMAAIAARRNSDYAPKTRPVMIMTIEVGWTLER